MSTCGSFSPASASQAPALGCAFTPSTAMVAITAPQARIFMALPSASDFQGADTIVFRVPDHQQPAADMHAMRPRQRALERITVRSVAARAGAGNGGHDPIPQ